MYEFVSVEIALSVQFTLESLRWNPVYLVMVTLVIFTCFDGHLNSCFSLLILLLSVYYITT